ncbi:MAG: CMD domain-containing protein [Janthinobacterium lividum]
MTDLIETLLGIAPGTGLALLRAERAAIRDHAQGANEALLTPVDPGGVSLAERANLAVLVAELEGEAALAAHFHALSPAPAGSARLELLRRYAGTVATRPDQVGQAGIDALSAAGLTARDIVAVTQLVAFVPYQVRLLAGLRAMQGRAASDSPVPAPAPVAFTMQEVGWTPRLPPVDAATASPAQLAALDACPPAVRRSSYFLTLAHDPASLEERGALFNSVMYAPRGLPRADRELATAIVSMVNGCVYCCSVHARRFAELSHEPAVMQALLEQGFAAPLSARRQAILAFAAKLTATPGAIGHADLAPLQAAGLVPMELLDLVHAIAMFANANRLMQALGESVVPVPMG